MLWIKALHIISVICWFAALFYLPRLFVYHALCEDAVGDERFKIMERKLYRAIATPSMLASLAFGGALMHLQWPYLQQSLWIWIKLVLVALLIVYHHLCAYHIKQFALGRNKHSDRYFRIFNELPVFVLFGVVMLAVVKPF